MEEIAKFKGFPVPCCHGIKLKTTALLFWHCTDLWCPGQLVSETYSEHPLVREDSQQQGPQQNLAAFHLRIQKQLPLDWIEQCFSSPPTHYRLYGRRFLQVKRPNQQYQSTEGESYKGKQSREHKENTKIHICIHIQNSRQIKDTRINTASPLVYSNMGWLGDSSLRGQGC